MPLGATSPHMSGCRVVRRRVIPGTTFILSMLILVFALLAMPGGALADDYDDLVEMVAQSKEIKAEIEAIQDEYLAAVQKASESEREAANAQAELDRIEGELAGQREKLAAIAVGSYKGNGSMSFLGALVDSDNIFDVLRNYEYLATVAAQRQAVVESVMELEREAAELPEKLAEQKRQAEELAGAASTAKETFDSELAAVKKKMQPYKSAYSERIAGMSGSEQMYEIISYLENVEDGTAEQVAIIQSAYRMTGSGGYSNLCERWVEDCIRGAGLSMPNYMSAWEDCKANRCSTDPSEMKAGCIVYAAGSGGAGNAYGHTGICVYANGNPDELRICDSVSSSGTSQSLSEWLSWQTSVNYETGATGFFGWGYPPGYHW